MKILKKLISISIISTSIISAYTISQLKTMPKSIERDFYIWQYLKSDDTSKQDAIEASKLIFRINYKLDKAYYNKTQEHLKRKKHITKIAHLQRYHYLFNQLKEEKSIFEGWKKLSSFDMLLFFNLAGKANRKLLNKDLENYLYNDLTKYKEINQFIYRVFKEHLNNLKDVILNSKPIKNNKISYKNLMKLGFENLKRSNPQMSYYFFYNAIFKASKRFEADRAIFWTYMATNDTKYLKKLSISYDFNIYKLIALDFLNKPYPTPTNLKIDSQKKINFDITNPIEWAKLKKKIFSKSYNLYELAKMFNTQDTQAHFYYILNKATHDKKQFFPIPYRYILQNYSIHRQALILAIARQESHFIPASISSSFAVGMMQFMPFLVKHIAKVRGEDVDLEDMFNPIISIKFANTHLDYLEKYLYHPLFVAYAYNAGIGYTRRLIRKNIFRAGEYEPYLSMELVDNPQANYYGKRVLANYVIYRMLLGSPVKITTLINQLTNPTLTDRFRKRN